jgi:MFS family permease
MSAYVNSCLGSLSLGASPWCGKRSGRCTVLPTERIQSPVVRGRRHEFRMSRRPDGPSLPPRKGVMTDNAEFQGTIEPLAGREWPERVRIVALCFASFVLCNCDRINISVAILPMASTYGWSQSTVGIIQSSFFWGYVTTQIPGGYLSDRFGGRRVLAFGVVAWSLMTVLTPLAASTSLPVLLASRALLGVGEGVAMPAMNQVLSRWVPRGERSKSLSLVYSGMYLGSTVGLLCCPTLIANFGWQSVFYFFGAFGGLWWLAWNTFTAENPQSSTTISPSELEFIEQNTAPSRLRPLESIPWRMLLSEKATWAIIVAHFCCTWGSYSFSLPISSSDQPSRSPSSLIFCESLGECPFAD